MNHSKQQIVDIRQNDMTIIQVEVDKPFVEFYKKETSKTRVTKKGLSKFIQHLVDIHN